MKRYAILILILVALLFWVPTRQVAVDEPEQTTSGSIVVGFSQVGAESDWRVANTESMVSNLSQENGYEMLYADARQKQDNQLLAIRTFIQQKVDYIVVAPITEFGWDTVLKEAKNAGIPVILMDRRVQLADPSLYTCWIGSDVPREAEIAMEWLAQETQEAPIRILHMMGTLGATSQIYRTEGLEKAVASNPDWTLVAQLEGEFTQAKAYEMASSYLKTDQDIDVIYCENDNMAFGVMEALDDYGLSYGRDGDIILISFDAARSALEACLAGKINLCMECNPLQGPLVEQIIAQLEEGSVPPKDAFVPETYFDTNTITQADIDKRAY